MSVSVQNSGLAATTAADIKQERLDLNADVVIVGSGAGGAVNAYELARKGLDVVVLEAGPYVPSRDFTEKFNDMLETLYQDHGGQTNADGDLLLLQGRCMGGSTVVNGCVCFRTPDFILDKWRTEHDLPELTEEALRPYFERVEQNLAIHENEEWEIARHSKLLREGAQNLNWSVRPFKRNINQCALTGHCLSGCKSERKQSMLVTYLPWAEAHGARIYADTEVTRVHAENGRARGVDAQIIDSERGKVADLSVTAERVILAAGAVQTPLLLQKSGLANSSGQVGRNFACHPSMFVLARFPEPVDPWRGALLGTYVDEFMDPEKGGFLLEGGGLGASEMALLNEPGTGQPFMHYMEDMRYYSGIVTLIHDHGVGEISWQEETKQVDYRIAEADFPTMQASIKASARLHFASGAEKVYVPSYQPLAINSVDEIDPVVDSLVNEPNGLRMVSYHPQGTCRMGTDPATSVVNSRGETHDVAGLYVADASLFPTSTIVNPQVTVYALANWIADGMLADMNKAA